MNAVIVSNLIKKYKNFEAVKGLSFNIKEGEIFALVGPNGVGKSTTLKILSTILSPTGGSVEIFGLDVNKDSKKIRKIISYLPEEAGAYKNLTGHEYLKFMASIFFRDKRRVLKTVKYGEELCGLKDKLKDKVKTYSKGMTRKLLL
ncbi:MAG: ABC transporter ATP-binding protein, partial [Elusimicrobiales bacterium]|nr:ABC transporter ATP-binding protein [Elusimicrobiales bacterium]